MTERRADDATREVNAWLKCEYLQEHVGDEFDGVISAVTSFGLFVELEDLYIEGLVHITALPGDYYNFDQAHQRLTGERSGAVSSLGARCGCRLPGWTSMIARLTWSWSTPSLRARPNRKAAAEAVRKAVIAKRAPRRRAKENRQIR